jgi:hypothetical protein
MIDADPPHLPFAASWARVGEAFPMTAMAVTYSDFDCVPQV